MNAVVFLKTQVGPVEVSTILEWGGAETMIFLDEPVAGLKDQERSHCDESDAQAQHDAWIAKVRKALEVQCDA